MAAQPFVEVVVDPDVTPDPPLEIRIIPAPAAWDDTPPFAGVPIIKWGDPSPVMHRWGAVKNDPEADGRFLYVMQCGAKGFNPSVVRYDHARRFARHCQRCTKAIRSTDDPAFEQARTGNPSGREPRPVLPRRGRARP